MTLAINGCEHTVPLEPRTTLLDTLRDRLGLSGTKKGCDQGTCGACTVVIDGKRVNSCLTLAVMTQGKAIKTIEGLAHNGKLHPVPGQIMSAVGLLAEKRPADAAGTGSG